MNRENFNIICWQCDRYVILKPGLGAEEIPSDENDLPPNTCVAIPSDKVRTFSLNIAPDEIKHLKKGLPFMLEESLTEDVATLHFANVPLTADQQAVAVVRRDDMIALQEGVPDYFCRLPWFPEVLCLPWVQSECTILFEDTTALVRWGETDGTRIEITLLKAMFETLECPPENIVAYGQDEKKGRNALPKKFQKEIQWRHGGWSEALLLVNRQPTLDLRQRDFRPKLPFLKWWITWRRVGFTLALALTFNTALAIADYQMLKAENLVLRKTINESYRRVNPTGSVVDVEKQLDRQLAKFGSGSYRTSFTPVVVEILNSAKNLQGISFNSINYRDDGDVRLNCYAADFQLVERFRQILSSGNLSAKLESSSASGDGVVARLRVGAR